MNESVKEISKLNQEVVEECKEMKREIISRVENVRKLNEELVKESKENIKKSINEWRDGPLAEPKVTYAAIVGGNNQNTKPEQKGKTLHSLVVTDKEDFMTGDEIITEIGKIINAKEEGIKVDRIRKGKGRKVIIGFSDKNDREKIRSKIENKTNQFEVEEMKNKDPQVVLYGVYKSISDEDLISAIKIQNSHLIQQNLEGWERVKVKYRRKGKDEQTEHVVMTVSPELWQRFTQAGHIYVDMQRVRVADQSPLIQCSHCLGYGHGKRHCNKATEEIKCSHCAGATTRVSVKVERMVTSPIVITLNSRVMKKYTITHLVQSVRLGESGRQWHEQPWRMRLIAYKR